MEEAVRKHLAKTLDSQRGRAAAAFRAAVASGEDNPPAIPLSDERNRIQSVRTLKIWATAASALAACLAVIVTLQVLSHPVDGNKNQPNGIATSGSIPPNHGTPLTPDANVPLMDQVELSREVDGGTALVQDNNNGPAMPVRVVRQQTLRQSQWFDPNEKATYRVTQPVETVNYQQIQPY
jgi:hypothetical protein